MTAITQTFPFLPTGGTLRRGSGIAMATAVDREPGVGLRRRRAVVINADVVGYSRLMADDAAATVAVMRDYHDLTATAVQQAGGTLVNFVGDSFVAMFDDARAAMQAAMSICAAVRERNAGVDPGRQVVFRMGLDAGDVVVADDGHHFGDVLNVAARIQGIAEVGGVNITETVYRELDEPALRFVPLGARHLRHIPGTVRVYRLVTPAVDAPGHAALTAVDDPVIAVLPFTSRNAEAQPYAEALYLDLVYGLGRIPGLRLLELPGGDGGLRAAAGSGDDHGAHYVLTGGVVATGGRVRVYAQLSEVSTMNRVWGDRWDGAADELFALQDAVTGGATRAVEVELVVGQPARIYRSALEGEALDAVYQGLHQLLGGATTAWRDTVDLFGSLVSSPRTETEAVGLSLSSFSLWWGVVHGLSEAPQDDLERAAEFAARGMALGDDTGLSHMVSAALSLHRGADPHTALEAAQRAVALRPSCDIAFAVQASVHRYLGEWERAIDAAQRAVELAAMPRPWFSTVLASAYYVAGRYQEAADVAGQVVDRGPGHLEAGLVLAAAQEALGLHRRAKATVASLLEQFPTVRRDGLGRDHPFRDPAILERWTAHLAAAGLP